MDTSKNTDGDDESEPWTKTKEVQDEDQDGDEVKDEPAVGHLMAAEEEDEGVYYLQL